MSQLKALIKTTCGREFSIRLSFSYYTLSKKASPLDRFCTKIQSSKISEFLGIFQDQKMDIISCHDCQFSKCKNQILSLLSLMSSKRKFIYIEYEIMKLIAASNATKLEQIFFQDTKCFWRAFRLYFFIFI